MKPILTVVSILICAAVARGQAPLGSAVTYQGRLVENGQPADGAYDLRFRLFDAAAGGSQVGATIDQPDLQVSGGLFTASLDFGSGAWDGSARWLEILARPGSSTGAYTPLLPRQGLTATPYAHGLRLPYEASGSVQSGAPLRVTNTFAGPLFIGYGLWGTSVHPGGRGVYGEVTNTTGPNVGVQGLTSSNQGTGVWGVASATTAGPFPSNGVAGRSSSPNGRGVYGEADSSTGINYGVHGKTNSADGYAGYFTGGRNYFQGNVGIGTTTPASPLQVMSNTAALETVYVRNAGSGRAALFESLGAGGSSAVLCYKNGGAALQVLGTFSAAGQTANDAPLAVGGGSDSAVGGGGYVVCGSTSGTNVSIDNNEIMARNNGAASTLFLNHDGGNISLIGAGTGSVGIGTSSPAHTLDVNGTMRPRDGIYFNGALGPRDSVQGGNVLSFGHPGVSEDQILYLHNRFYFIDSPGGGDVVSPDVWAQDFITYSDVRLKRDIEPVTGALGKVLQLNGIRYRFDGKRVDPQAVNPPDDPAVHIGFSAQEVAEVVPEAVHYSKELDRFGVNYASLVPLLVEAIKEQQAQIDVLWAEVAELKRGADSPLADH